MHHFHRTDERALCVLLSIMGRGAQLCQAMRGYLWDAEHIRMQCMSLSHVACVNRRTDSWKISATANNIRVLFRGQTNSAASALREAQGGMSGENGNSCHSSPVRADGRHISATLTVLRNPHLAQSGMAPLRWRSSGQTPRWPNVTALCQHNTSVDFHWG
jgi:hypothetical protein